MLASDGLPSVEESMLLQNFKWNHLLWKSTRMTLLNVGAMDVRLVVAVECLGVEG